MRKRTRKTRKKTPGRGRRVEPRTRAIEATLADLAHEIRTPLTVIRGQLEVALITAKTTEQYRDAMIAALEDVERLSNIVRALLLLSQSDNRVTSVKSSDSAPAIEGVYSITSVPRLSTCPGGGLGRFKVHGTAIPGHTVV